jgi:hypothetical protein
VKRLLDTLLDTLLHVLSDTLLDVLLKGAPMNNENLHLPFTSVYQRLGRVVLFCTLLVSAAATADASGLRDNGSHVGTVTLVVGKAYRQAADQSPQRLENGAPVFVGDVLSTRSNGHVHIRFVDEGLVSVRPASRLHVERYDYDPAQPQQSIIRLQLDEGQLRSISGRGAKANREYFRLNTPIAAIGVRGTDFVVNADRASLRALVNEGAIAVAPFSATCAVSGLTRCDEGAVELDGLSGQMLEFNSMLESPRLVPREEQLTPGQLQGEVQRLEQGGDSELQDAEEAGASDDSQAQDSAEKSAGGADSRVEKVGAVFEELGGVTKDLEVLKNDPGKTVPTGPVATTPPAPEPSPPPVIEPELPPQPALVWGRWSAGMHDDELSVSQAEAAAGREVTVGLDNYILYRDRSALTELQPGLGRVDFALNQATATLQTEAGSQALAVNSGHLSVDFGRRQFATGLTMEQQGNPQAIRFEDSGAITNNGFFTSRSQQQRLLGATALDGSEASYYFQLQHELGKIQGLTHWWAK